VSLCGGDERVIRLCPRELCTVLTVSALVRSHPHDAPRVPASSTGADKPGQLASVAAPVVQPRLKRPVIDDDVCLGILMEVLRVRLPG